MDILLNEKFDLDLDDRNDLSLRTGKDLFEQRLRISITSFFQDVIGEVQNETVLQLLESYAEDVADGYSEIEGVADFKAEYDDKEPNIINLTVIYNTGDALTFSVSE